MKRKRKREMSQDILTQGERFNATFGSSKHRTARILRFIAKQLQKERKRTNAKRFRRHP